jgi:hypothetical protein
MYKWLLIVAILTLAACQVAPRTPTPIDSTLQNTEAEAQPQTPEAEDTPHWLEAEDNGVPIGIWQPTGWEGEAIEGLLVAEHTLSIETGEREGGVMVHVFVAETHNIEVSVDDSGNYAWAFLDRIVTMPSHTGNDVAVSDPIPFHWTDHDAAYYLVSSAEGFKALVFAVELPERRDKVVVINITAPAREVSRIRPMLPRLLDDLMIGEARLAGIALEVLPNPLQFPHYASS